MARYSLYVGIEKTDEKYLIPLKELDNNGREVFKEKVDLATIDKLTLKYENASELLAALYEEGLSRKVVLPLKEVEFTIQYKSKGEQRPIPVAYSRLSSELKHFNDNAPVKVSIVDSKYRVVLDKFLNNCFDSKFLKYQIENNFLHEFNAAYVKEYIDAVNSNDKRSIDRIYGILLSELSRYKRVRGMIVGSEEYYLEKEKEENEQALFNGKKMLISDSFKGEHLKDIETINIPLEDDEEYDPDTEIFSVGYPGDRLSNQSVIDGFVKRISQS